MLKRDDALIIGRGIPAGINCLAPNIALDNAAFIAALVAQGVPNPNLPPNPPFEIHPYKPLFPLQNFEKYIIGTFPPISYVLDRLLIINPGITSLNQPGGAHYTNAPIIPFYHGNNNSMWPYLLTPPEWAGLVAVGLKNNKRTFLINKLIDIGINYGDIIDSTQRRLTNGNYNASDNNLYNICINNDLICHILTNPNAKYLLFNTASVFTAGGLINVAGLVNVNLNTKSFDLFIRGCQEMGYKVELRIAAGIPATIFPWTNINALLPNQRMNKIAFEIRITNPDGNSKGVCNSFKTGQSKILTVIVGPFPAPFVAGVALAHNAQCIAWIHLNPDAINNDFIINIYKGFRNGNWPDLYGMNQ